MAAAAREEAFAGGMTPLEFLLDVMRTDAHEFKDRLDAAKAAAPYVHPKLANVEHTGRDGGPVQVVIANEDTGLL